MAERLPTDVLQVIFPLDYWPTIRRHAEARGLDPYLVAALVAQESTFQADARSVANAWGLMQIIPSTGRRLARAEGMRRFRTSQLVDPETNVRLGTRYFAGLLDRFGTEHFALAGYNAGESRVVRWRAERPDWAREEFIDDIPFPETQNYVKRILGTAEDYRRLYGERGAVPVAIARRATAAPASPGSMSESRPARNTSKAKPRSTSRSKAASQKKSSTRKTSSTPPATRKSL
jgi:soluble lytic murein transglycosylase